MLKKIKGAELKSYIPKAITLNIITSVNDVGLIWNDQLIAECTLTLGENGEGLVVYDQNPITGSGTFLFGFHQLSENDHRFTYSQPWKHLTYSNR